MRKRWGNLSCLALLGGSLVLGACGNGDTTSSAKQQVSVQEDDYTQYKGIEKTVRKFVGDNFTYGPTKVNEVNTQDGKTVVVILTQEHAKAKWISRYSNYIAAEVGEKEGKVNKLTILWNDGDAKYVAERMNKTQMTITKEIVNVE